MTFTYDVLHRLTRKAGTNTDTVTWAYSAPLLRTVTATSPITTETTYRHVLGQPDSIKTVMVGQTYWRRYRYRKTSQLASDTIAGGGIPWLARRYAYDTSTAVLASIT